MKQIIHKNLTHSEISKNWQIIHKNLTHSEISKNNFIESYTYKYFTSHLGIILMGPRNLHLIDSKHGHIKLITKPLCKS